MIRKQAFGKTGHQSTVTIFGAAAFWAPSQEEVDSTFDTLLEFGINHIDTAASYGESELHVGPWMKHHRDRFFLATKTDKRTYKEAKEQIHLSLERLQTDHVDLLQLHFLVPPDEWETAMGPGGALEAAIEAKEQGLARFIGVTGHDWSVARMHRNSLERYPFDSVLLPLNYHMMSNPDYRREFTELRELCQKREIAFQTIKAIARGPWDDNPKTRNTWYQPYEDQADIDRAVHYVLGHEGAFLNTVGDLNLLPKVLDAARRYHGQPAEESMRSMAESTGMRSIFSS
jgi:aryl-alcohol dehydrogenase-like predicted oxidoreductase